jgi:Fe-S cluster biogenesis protein NfuA
MSSDIRLEFTPNPNALKYVVDGYVFMERGTANFTDKSMAAARSPLAKRIMDIPGVASCLIGRDYVTVAKSEDGDWEFLDERVRSGMKTHMESGLPAVDPSDLKAAISATSSPTSDLDAKIKDILDREIRPAVAMDGGDIVFERFEAGVVYLYMQGACSGCPSSTATLKMGIETRLKKAIPEISEVVAL